MINAIIYVLRENYGVSAARCLEYCAAKQYNVVGLVPGDRQAAIQMLADGLAAVVVVNAAEQLNPARDPRIEVVPKRFTTSRNRTSSAAPARCWQLGDPARAKPVREAAR